MKIKRILLWVIPVLFLISVLFFAITSAPLLRQEQEFEQARQEGWTVYFEPTEGLNYIRGGWVGDGNHIVVDATDRIWIAGGTGLGGLNVYDGATWFRQSKTYDDLAIGPQGQILATQEFVGIADVTNVPDGQEPTIYESPVHNDSDIHQRVLQVEIDSNGRIWVVLFWFIDDFEFYSISEMFIQNEDATFSEPEITVKNSRIRSFRADGRGNIWASIWNDFDVSNTWKSGLYVFDGAEWKGIAGEGLDLHQVVQTAFDKQGHVWVVTACGGVYTYDGENWEIVQERNIIADCRQNPLLEGIALDNQERVWVWNRESVKYLNGKERVTFTPENSGIVGSGTYAIGPFIHEVLIDNLDRVWVSSSIGISVGAIKDIQPLTEEDVSNNVQAVTSTNRLQGKVWLIPLLLALLWFALYFNMPRSIVLALTLGLVLSIFMGPVKVEEPFYGDIISYINPLFTASLVGIVFGYVCGLIVWLGGSQKNSETIWDIIVTIIGFVIGFSYGMFMKMLPAMLI
ncbi:MAG TPA: hypothetical protein PLD25_07960 [Chloroflexota bacterium]|nr:hypothetical protein [Chloroflexota bacterium]HUM68164.1 hypothetical protein [Chloroflexota bacterium]